MQRIMKSWNKWGLSKQPIELMNKSNVVANNITGGPISMVLLNWFNNFCGNFKFKYDVIDTN